MMTAMQSATNANAAPIATGSHTAVATPFILIADIIILDVDDVGEFFDCVIVVVDPLAVEVVMAVVAAMVVVEIVSLTIFVVVDEEFLFVGVGGCDKVVKIGETVLVGVVVDGASDGDGALEFGAFTVA